MSESISTARSFYERVMPSVEIEPLRQLPQYLYQFVWKVSAPQQIRLCILSAAALPLSMVPLELQRRIINGATEGMSIKLLAMFGALYLATILVQGGFKYVRGVYLGRVSEGVIRRMRMRVLRSMDKGDDSEAGTRVSMISSETEQIGGFVGNSVAEPMLSAGTMMTVAGYMLWTDPLIALIAFAFFLPSLAVAPWLQRSMNRHSEARTKLVRKIGNQVVDAGEEPEKKGVSRRARLVQMVYDRRLALFVVKYFAKFLTNLTANIGQLAVLVIGACLVVQGRTEIGVVVAFMSGFDRISEPARALLNFYRQQSQMYLQYRLMQQAIPTVQLADALSAS